MTILHVDSSILTDQSVSRQLTAAIAQRLAQGKPGEAVIYRDLVAAPIGHLSAAEFLAFQGVAPADEATRAAVQANAQLLEEFLAADTVVLGAPMYNFALPSQLRAWLDRLAVPGRTFRYGEAGVEGLAGGKRVVIASSRGGLYGEGQPAASLDHQETYLRGFLGFLGITDVTIVRAEGVAYGPDARAAAVAAAIADVDALAA